jgi:hypothetical protein
MYYEIKFRVEQDESFVIKTVASTNTLISYLLIGTFCYFQNTPRFMLSVQQPLQDDNSETYVRLWSSVCVARNELTKIWVSELR